MDSWALSKQAPGAWMGGTGIKKLGDQDLHKSGFQAWAKKVGIVVWAFDIKGYRIGNGYTFKIWAANSITVMIRVLRMAFIHTLDCVNP